MKASPGSGMCLEQTRWKGNSEMPLHSPGVQEGSAQEACPGSCGPFPGVHRVLLEGERMLVENPLHCLPFMEHPLCQTHAWCLVHKANKAGMVPDFMEFSIKIKVRLKYIITLCGKCFKGNRNIQRT